MTIPTVAFLGGSIGGPELAVVAIAVLILFGPKRLPEIAKTIGRITAQLRGAAQDFRDQITKAAEEPPAPTDPASREPEGGGTTPIPDGAGTPAKSSADSGPSGLSGKGGDLHDRAG